MYRIAAESGFGRKSTDEYNESCMHPLAYTSADTFRPLVPPLRYFAEGGQH
jgi:hypothetical protein